MTVNAVAPGFIKTRMTDVVAGSGAGSRHERDARSAGWATRRRSPPAVVFLASEAAAFITGHVLDINGGYAM